MILRIILIFNRMFTDNINNIWKHYLNIDYLPIVNVRKVTSKNYKNSAVAEISNYKLVK